MNETNTLVAFGFLLLVICALGRFKTLLEVFERAIKFFTVLEVNSNDLVYSHQLAADFTLDL